MTAHSQRTPVSRGRARPPLACGCTEYERCADGERLWQAVQAAGKWANVATYVDLWPAYARAHQAYAVHVAANKPGHATETRTKHPQWEKERVWVPESEAT